MSLGNKETMAKNIKRLMAMNQVNATDVCAALGFKAPTFSDWVNAKTYPRIDKIEAMSNYFGVSKADLVEEQPPSDSISSKDIEILKKFHALDERGKGVVEAVLNAEYEHQKPALHVVAAANGQRAFFEERDDLPPLLPEDPPDV